MVDSLDRHDPGDLRDERVLAHARLVLSGASLIAVYLDPTEPGRFAALTYSLLVVYVGVSATIAAMIETTTSFRARLAVLTHVFDMLWLTAMTSVSGASSSPLFVVQTFVLFAAAYRWGFLETVATAAVLGAVLFGQLIFADSVPEEPFELNQFIVRAAYMLTVGVLLGYLAAHARFLRQQAGLVARLLTHLQSATRLTKALEICVRESSAIFGARAVVIAVRDENTGRTVVWTAPLSNGDDLLRADIAPDQPNPYFFPAPEAFTLTTRGNRAVIGPGPEVPADTAMRGRALVDAFPIPFRYALVAGAAVGDEWCGRVFLLDPRRGWRGRGALRLFQAATTTIAPALHSIHLVGQVRRRARAREREQLARELHDTAIQALIALDMELIALGRRTADPAMKTALTGLESRLRAEVEGLRSLMQTLGESNAAPQAITDRLSEELARFQVETRIRTRLISPLAVVLPAPVGREVLRLVQAALSNVRRHSAATRVDVILERDVAGWLLVIEDNGGGFMTAVQRGDCLRVTAPRSMRERVTALGGEVVVDRAMPSGVRLEIRLPATVTT